VLKNSDVRNGQSVQFEEEVDFLRPPMQTKVGYAEGIRLGAEERRPLGLR
jgi:hypothetical protein